MQQAVQQIGLMQTGALLSYSPQALRERSLKSCSIRSGTGEHVDGEVSGFRFGTDRQTDRRAASHFCATGIAKLRQATVAFSWN